MTQCSSDSVGPALRWDIVMAEPGGEAPVAREWHCAVGLLDCVVVVTPCSALLLLQRKGPGGGRMCRPVHMVSPVLLCPASALPAWEGQLSNSSRASLLAGIAYQCRHSPHLLPVVITMCISTCEVHQMGP